MNKIIAAIDAMHFSEDELKSFQYLTKKARGDLKVVFLENIVGQDIYLANAYPEGGGFIYEEIYERIIKDREKSRIESLDKFNRFCENIGSKIALHEATGSPVTEVIAESRFADLLLINNATSFAALHESNPAKFVKDALAEAQCPVLILPEKVNPVHEILFTYNGTFSSMYAIRQFTHLFPDFSHIPVSILYVSENEDKSIPQEKQLREYMKHHYTHVKYSVLIGRPKTVLLSVLLHKTDCIVTFGAYGRSGISRFFHHSDADSILRTSNVPLFITHP